MTTPRETELDGKPPAEAEAAATRAGAPPAPAADAAGPAASDASAVPAGPQPATPEPVEPSEAATAAEPDAVPRAGGARPTAPAAPPVDPGSGWAQGAERGAGPGAEDPTTVLPGGRRGAPQRAVPPRPAARAGSAGGARPVVGRSRRARLSLRRIDPWSVFLFSLVASVFLGIALVVAVAVLYAVLGSLGVTASVNQLFAEVTGGSPTTGALLTSGRIIGGAAVLAAVNVVFLTLLSTLGALLYNLCASFTGGLELTLGERD